jgi:hypothetical protein
MKKILEKADIKFAQIISDFYRGNNIGKKKKILKQLVEYIYSKSCGPMPTNWNIK